MKWTTADLKRRIRLAMDRVRYGDSIGTAEAAAALATASDDIKAAKPLLATQTDDAALDSRLDNIIPEAVKAVETACPVHRLIGLATHTLPTAVSWEGEPFEGVARINLPADFMRLVSLQMSDWLLPATETIETGSPEYLQLRSRHAGIRGSTERPRVAVVRTEAQPRLELFSCASQSATLTHGIYLPLPTVSKELEKRPTDPVLHNANANANVIGTGTISGGGISGGIQQPIINAEKPQIEIADRLEEAVIHYAAYMACLTLGDVNAAEAMLTLSKQEML